MGCSKESPEYRVMRSCGALHDPWSKLFHERADMSSHKGFVGFVMEAAKDQAEFATCMCNKSPIICSAHERKAAPNFRWVFLAVGALYRGAGVLDYGWAS